MGSRVIAMIAAAAAACGGAGTLQAHHANIMLDTTAPLWLRGTVVSYTPMNPHTLFELDVDEGGRARRWLVEGPFLARLKRMGVDDRLLKAGDRIEVCGFALKESMTGQPASAAAYRGQPFVHGHVLRMPDGRLRAWGPYGKIHNCVQASDDLRPWLELLRSDPLAREAWCDRARAAVPARAESRAAVDEINRALAPPCGAGAH